MKILKEGGLVKTFFLKNYKGLGQTQNFLTIILHLVANYFFLIDEFQFFCRFNIFGLYFYSMLENMV